MAGHKDWVSILRGMAQRMAAADITDLEVRRQDLRIRLRRDPGAASKPALVAGDGRVGREDGRENGQALHRVVAPLTGVFYAAPDPTGRPYVAVGDWADHDTVVGLIETMKVFNEVTADCRGRVAALLVQQGQLVHAGEAILLVDVTAVPDHAGEVTS